MTRLRQTTCTLVILIGLLWVCASYGGMEPHQQTNRTTPVKVEEGVGQYPLGLHLNILEDPERQWKMSDITLPGMQKQFRPSQSVRPNFQMTSSAYWLKFTLEFPENYTHPLLLEIKWPLHDSITFYGKIENGFKGKTVGDKMDFFAREIPHRNFLFGMTPNPGASSIYYLRIQSENMMYLPITLWEKDQFFLNDRVVQYILGFFYGIMFIMCAYNLFIYFSVRDISYLSYVGYILSLSFLLMSLDGTANEYFWHESPKWGDVNVFLMFFIVEIFLILFSRSLLESKRNSPRTDKILVGFLWYSVLGLVYCLVGTFFGSVSGLVLTGLICIATPVIIFLIIAGGISLKNGVVAARYFLCSFGLYFLCIVLYLLSISDVLPSVFFSNYGINVGYTLEAIILSFALGSRISSLREEHEMALTRQLEEADKNLSLINTFEKFIPKQFIKHIAKDGLEKIQLGKAGTTVPQVLQGMTPCSYSTIKSIAMTA